VKRRKTRKQGRITRKRKNEIYRAEREKGKME